MDTGYLPALRAFRTCVPVRQSAFAWQLLPKGLERGVGGGRSRVWRPRATGGSGVSGLHLAASTVFLTVRSF